MNLEKAIMYAKIKGKKNIQKELADALYPNASPSSRPNQISNLKKKLQDNPRTKIPANWVNIICEKCGVDANFLFDCEKISE